MCMNLIISREVFLKLPLKNYKSITTLEENVFKSFSYVHKELSKSRFYFKLKKNEDKNIWNQNQEYK